MSKSYNKNLEYIILEDFYTETELSLVWKEIDFLSPNLLGPEKTGSATLNGKFLKNNKGIFLDYVYSYRQVSNILTFNENLWSDAVLDYIEKVSPWWRLLRESNSHYTLLNYYGDNQSYDLHEDKCVLTATVALHSQPRNFTGGDFVFPDHNVTIPCKSNSLIIFPSVVKHAVTPVKIIDPTIPNSGRYSITQFIYLSHLET
jgi:hypothetical protein